ncbi:PHP domain-containing protein [Halopenitus sp. H-Gu1]|uniref:PHP domain-containing protein n=1 Tax=Halopenitus sp. H-Gu1 TaxID=3242697 RepID=UPI00359CE6D4
MPTGPAQSGTDRPAVPRENRSIVADLHVHTTASDGTLTLSEIPSAAERAGLEWVAVTDHDRIHPRLPEPVVEREGISIVRGIELRVDAGDERFDLLGYGVKETDALVRETELLQRDRRERGRRIIDRVQSRLDVRLDIEPRPGIGRPHIAQAIADSPAPYDYADAFADLIGADGPCYVPRQVTSLDRGIDLLSESCAVVALAHPFRYGDVDAALELARELDAVERWYPYGFDVDPSRIDRLLERGGLDLLATGGTDAHDRTLGVAGLTQSAFEPVRRAILDHASVT